MAPWLLESIQVLDKLINEVLKVDQGKLCRRQVGLIAAYIALYIFNLDFRLCLCLCGASIALTLLISSRRKFPWFKGAEFALILAALALDNLLSL